MYGESIFTTVIIIGLDKRLDLSGYNIWLNVGSRDII